MNGFLQSSGQERGRAATVKAHMLTHLNAGNDIETPAQMCKAVLLSSGGQSMSVSLCKSIISPPKVHYKIDGMCSLLNIQISKEGIHAWRAYDVRPGRRILQKFDVPLSEGLPSITVIQVHPSSFSSVVKRRADSVHSSGLHACRSGRN